MGKVMDMPQFPVNLDILFEHPELLGSATPEEWYEHLKKTGHLIKPLNRGKFEDIEFKAGGGFRIHWSGDRILQYHPPGGRWHVEDAYWKLSNGTAGTKRYDLAERR